MKKTNEQLLIESNLLNEAYARANLFDLEKENEYLTRVLRNLYDSVQSDVLEDNWSKHLNSAMDDAAEVLGFVE